MELFITFTRRHWYRKKRFVIPICLLTTMLIGAIILGSVLGTRTSISPTGTTFDILLSSKTLKMLDNNDYATFVFSSLLRQIFFKLENTLYGTSINVDLLAINFHYGRRANLQLQFKLLLLFSSVHHHNSYIVFEFDDFENGRLAKTREIL